MKEVDFYEANLSKADLSESLLTHATFNKTNLSGADLRGAKEYFIDPRLCNVKKAKFSMPEALTLLNSLEIVLE